MVTSTSRVHVASSAATLWRCLTEPDLVLRWQYGARLETTWEPGAPIRFSAQWQGEEVAQWGTVLSFDPPRSLAYTLFTPREGVEDVEANRFTMRYDLVEGDGVVDLSITQEDPRPGAHPAVDDESPVLGALRDLAEGL
ncbi:MAG: SRPBCC family protein [Acidimicrobiales bacterium]